MKLQALFFQLITVVVFVSCDCRQDKSILPAIEKDKHAVVWNDGVELYTVTLNFDGAQLGHGEKAYRLLIAKLKELPNGSFIVFYAPKDVVVLLNEFTGSAVADVLPFRDHERAEVEFDDLCAAKNFVVKLSPYEKK